MEDSFSFYYIVAFIMSSLSSIILNLLLRKKQSNYSKLMRYICLSEAIYIYCEFVIIMTYNEEEDSLKNSFSKFFSQWTHYLFANS
jgi:uncharacterized membrane protein